MLLRTLTVIRERGRAFEKKLRCNQVTVCLCQMEGRDVFKSDTTESPGAPGSFFKRSGPGT